MTHVLHKLDTIHYSLSYQAIVGCIQIKQIFCLFAQWLTLNRLTYKYTISTLSLFLSQGVQDVLRSFSNYTIIYIKLFTERIWIKTCGFVSMSSKLLVFIRVVHRFGSTHDLTPTQLYWVGFLNCLVLNPTWPN